MLNRSTSDAPAAWVFTPAEMILLDHLVKDKAGQRRQQQAISAYLIKVARLGGYLARARDSPPGNCVVWRGMSRLTDIELGFGIGAKIVGN